MISFALDFFCFGSTGFNFLICMVLRCARFAGADALLKRRKSGKYKKYLCKLENTEKSIWFSVKPNFKSDIQNIFNRLLHFHARQMDQRLGFSVTESVLILNFGECEPFFFRFKKYLYIVCLKMAHLGRVAYCFETLLFLCKLVFFDYSHFHKNIRWRQKRFLSKQGQPSASHSIEGQATSWTTEKWSAWGYITRSIITASQFFLFNTVCKIRISFSANLRNTPLASSLFILLLYLI